MITFCIFRFFFAGVTFSSPSRTSSSGLLVSYCGEVCRHAEGQGAAASAAAAGAADAAAQQCHHLGEPDGPGRPHPAVSGSKKSRRVAHLHRHLIRPLLQPRGQRRCSQCLKTRQKKIILYLSSCSLPPFVLSFFPTHYCSLPLVLRK